MTKLLAGWANGLRAGGVGLLFLCAAGCRHKAVPVAIQVPPPSPVPLEPTPEPKTPPLVASLPSQPIPLPTVTIPPQKKPKRAKKAAAPVQVAAVPPPPNVAALPAADPSQVIGALTAGGEQVPELHQQTVELIAANEKRLAGLSADVRDKQKEQLIRVQNFQKQAQVALTSGDTDGAYTLATKAKLLLDDLQK